MSEINAKFINKNTVVSFSAHSFYKGLLLRKNNLEIRCWINDLAAYRNKDYNFIIINPEPYSEESKKEIVLRKIG